MNMKLFSFVYTDTTQFTRFLTQAQGRVEVRSSLEFKTGTWPVILYTKTSGFHHHPYHLIINSCMCVCYLLVTKC